MKILVIEDNLDMAGFYKLWLGRVSDDVTVTGDLDHAMEIINEATDLITLDLNLSEHMRVDSTLARISEIKLRAPNALIIVLTGAMQLDDQCKALAAGADGFIHKSEANTEKTFFGKLAEWASSIMGKPPVKMEQHLRVLEMIGKKTAEYFNENQKQQ